MIELDRLSARMGVNYMDLFAKAEVYNRKTDSEEPKKIKEIFTETEETFLACVALEYLKANRILKPSQLPQRFTDDSYVLCRVCGHKTYVSEGLDV